MSDADIKAEVAEYRQSIDNIDAALVHILAERFHCTKAVGVLKARHHLPSADPDREEYQIERLRRLARDANLDPNFAEKFLNFIIRKVIRHHEAIAVEHGGTYSNSTKSGTRFSVRNCGNDPKKPPERRLRHVSKE